MKQITLFFLVSIFVSACSADEKPVYLAVEGKTMGTYYRVTYLDSLKRDFKRPIDSLLIAINNEISTYEPNSTVSKLNNGTGEFELGLFSKTMQIASLIHGLAQKSKTAISMQTF